MKSSGCWRTTSRTTPSCASTPIRPRPDGTRRRNRRGWRAPSRIAHHFEEAIMKLKDITTDPVRTLAPTTTLHDAAQTMRDRDLGWMPVVERDKVVGIVTDRDLVIRGVASGMQPKTNTVREV